MVLINVDILSSSYHWYIFYILTGARILLGGRIHSSDEGVERLYVLTKSNEVSSIVSTLYPTEQGPVAFCHGYPLLYNWTWLEGFNLGEMKTFSIRSIFQGKWKETETFFKGKHYGNHCHNVSNPNIM